MIGTLHGVVLDCPDPRALAGFYQKLVGGRIEASDEQWANLTDGPTDVALGFQRAPDHRPPAWPGDGERGQQLHLDVLVSDLDAAEPLVLALGATLLESSDGHAGWRVYADPAGHPFCLVTS